MPNYTSQTQTQPVELTPRKQADEIMRLAREAREVGGFDEGKLMQIRQLAGKLRARFPRA